MLERKFDEANGSTLILAAAIIVAGFVAGETSRPTYAIVNAGGGGAAAFYRLNRRTGVVQMYAFYPMKNAWGCMIGTDSTCSVPHAR